MKKAIKVAIAEDHTILRNGLISLLSNIESISVVLSVANGRELLDNLERELPNVVLLDIDMPILGGKETLKQIRKSFPEISVIMISMHYNETFITEYIDLGASAFLAKNCDFGELIDTISGVVQGGYHYNAHVRKILEKKSYFRISTLAAGRFTNRELEILELLRLHKTNDEIAEQLNISVRTVEGHRSNILQKIGGKSLKSYIASAI